MSEGTYSDIDALIVYVKDVFVLVVGGAHMVGMRRVGETEGVRQSLGNMQQPVSTLKDLAALSRRIVVRQIDPAVLR